MWDAPVRVVHWMVVALVVIAWITREARWLDIHAAAGYCILGLCTFRLVWGIVGTRHARFGNFLHSPRAAIAYLATITSPDAEKYTGHNPAGSWSIYLLLAAEIAVCASGIVAIAGMHAMGPLAGYIGYAAADKSLRLHEIAAWTMLAIVASHLIGVAVSSLVQRENLPGAMLSGMKRTHGAQSNVRAHRPTAFALAAASIAFAALYLSHARSMSASPRGSTGPAAQVPKAWLEECGSCHLAYAACLLPERSWQRMLVGQEDHFGEDLGLGEAAVRQLARLAQARDADEPWSCWKTRASVGESDAPLRVTETRYWIEAHARLDNSAFKAPVSAGRHDCGACHRDAGSSIFHPRLIRVPR